MSEIETTTGEVGLMTADEARQQSKTDREGNPNMVAKLLTYYRRAIEHESLAGNFSAAHYPSDLLENRVTRHDLAEVQDMLRSLGYHLDEEGVSWGDDFAGDNKGGILARAIDTRFVRRNRAEITSTKKDGE